MKLKLKFHDKALYTQREKEINELKKINRQKIKNYREIIKQSNCKEEKEWIKNRIKTLLKTIK